MIFRNWVLQNFPFLEDDFDALTDYELFCKMVEYMKKSLDKVTEYQTQLNEFRAELDSYKNYFDNLDVQEEINNKLDEMAESGELSDIVAQYLTLAGVLAYQTISDLKDADNVANGSICKTLGFNSINDGGASYYKIREIVNTDVIDEKYLIALTNSNTLVAEFMNTDKKINPMQFGAYGDGTHDDTAVLQYTLDYADTNKLEVYLPTPGSYYKITDGLVVKIGRAHV